MKRVLAVAGLGLALAGCNDQYASSGRSLAPIPPRTTALMAEKGMSKSDPILVRLYKKESELEVWKKAPDGKYALLKTFPICRWSGQLGPKRREGDRQAPEGFYTVTPAQMNPNSSYYLSFNTGFPNAYDRTHGGTGSDLMVHGNCSSRGCYAMTDEGISEVYALARESFSGGQRGFQFQAYPFRMTAENFAKYRYDPNMPFWRNLKEGSDNFEVTKIEPKVAVCNGRYAFNTVGANGCAPDPTLAPVLAEKEARDRTEIAELVAKGTPAVKVVYADGGGHDSFRQAMSASASDDARSFAVLDTRPARNLGDVSRPDALAAGPREVAIDAAGRTVEESRVAAAPVKAPAVKVAATAAPAPDRAPAKPATAPSRLIVASADATAVEAAPPAPSESKSLYDRMIGLIATGKEPVPAPAAAIEPDPAPAAVAAKAPARRPVTAAATTAKPAAPRTVLPAPRPQAALPSAAAQKVAAVASARAAD